MHSPDRNRLSSRRALGIAGRTSLLLGIGTCLTGWLSGYHTVLLLGAVAIATGTIWLICARLACDEPLRPAGRRYMREFFPAMIAYVAFLFASLSMLPHVHAIPLKVLVALLPVLPVAWVVRAMVRLILASDEMERRMQLEAISIASLSVGLLSFAAAFLHSAGLLPVDNLLMLVLPVMFAFYGLAMWWVKRRYRAD